MAAISPNVAYGLVSGAIPGERCGAASFDDQRREETRHQEEHLEPKAVEVINQPAEEQRHLRCANRPRTRR